MNISSFLLSSYYSIVSLLLEILDVVQDRRVFLTESVIGPSFLLHNTVERIQKSIETWKDKVLSQATNTRRRMENERANLGVDRREKWCVRDTVVQ